MKEVRKIIGENIRCERIKRAMTLDDLSEILDITSGFLGLVERGQRGMDISKYLKVAKIFDKPLDELVVPHKEQDNKIKNDLFDPIENEKLSLNSMIYDLNTTDLEFVISVVRELKKMKNSR